MNKNEGEKKIVSLMIGMFCRAKHGMGLSLCDDCRNLLDYVVKKLDECPFKNKPRCSDCKVHCYAPDRRSAIREVMRYSGKRMIIKHPVATIVHYLKKRR